MLDSYQANKESFIIRLIHLSKKISFRMFIIQILLNGFLWDLNCELGNYRKMF